MSREWWRTKDGRTVFIDEMNDEHLLNTIRFVERKARQTDDDLNRWAWEVDDFENWAGIILGSSPKYKALRSEAERRGLVCDAVD